MTHHALYQEQKETWRRVYADQLTLVDNGLTTSLWKAPGL
jgi:hypothetical protein